MGNHRFRFSDMIPNAWFYKLRDMNKTNRNPHSKTLNPTNKKHSSSSSSPSLPAKDHKPHLSDQRKSYHFTRELSFQPIHKTPSDKPEPPRLSSRRRRSTKRNRRPPLPPPRSAVCSCRATFNSVWTKPDPDSSLENSSPSSSSDLDSVLTEYGSDDPCSESCKFRAENDFVIEIIDENKSLNEIDNHLPPIITKKTEPTKIERTSTEISERNKYGSLSVKVVKENFVNSPSPGRRISVTSSSPGVKLRTNSPRIANLRPQGRRSLSSNSSSGGARRSVSESVAVVKSSKDPRRDFRESMVEMILENNIRASKDLEELLACYLSLNSDEYHDLIVNVFKQIWFDFIHLRLK